MIAVPLLFCFFSLLLLPVHGHDLHCEDGWTYFSGSCYVYISNKASWSDAQSICGLLGGHLPEIENSAENAFLASMMVKLGLDKIWLGCQDFVHEGRYVWTSTNRPVRYTNWDKGQPDNVHDQDCGAMYRPGTWDDEWCKHDRLYAFFCEKPARL